VTAAYRKRWTAMTAIVALDRDTGDLGVAVESKYLAAGAVVPFARAGVGAIASAGVPNVTYGARGLDLLAAGASADEVLRVLTEADPEASWRQVAIIDARGRTATYTGDEMRRASSTWSGELVGKDVALIGTSLIGGAALELMCHSFESADGPLWQRLVEALELGQHMGGDTRSLGEHSAALLVVRKGGGYGGYDDRLIDLRVDDHPHPVEQLEELLNTYVEHHLPTNPSELVPLDQDLVTQIQTSLARTRDYRGWITGTYDAATRVALERFAARLNLEERMRYDDLIDPALLGRLEVPEMWRLRLSPLRRQPRRDGKEDSRARDSWA
jgi:uncharacterized Ntn-hydrolase superfamily protein